jgi:hypothetical protein
MSLKSAFDQLDLIPEYDERNIPTPEDILKPIEESYREPYEDMTKFNLKILNDKSWGDISEKNVNDRYTMLKPKKLSQKDLSKELSKLF